MLTAQDIARRIAPTLDRAEIRRTAQRVKHWAARKLLQPVESDGTGPGRYRRYDEDAVYQAALLLEMSLLNLPLDMMRRAMVGIQTPELVEPYTLARATAAVIARSLADEEAVNPVYMTVMFGDSFRGQHDVRISDHFSIGASYPKLLGTSHVVINLTRVFARVRP